MSCTYERNVEDMFETFSELQEKLRYTMPLTMEDRERVIRYLDSMRAMLGTTNVTVRE